MTPEERRKHLGRLRNHFADRMAWTVVWDSSADDAADMFHALDDTIVLLDRAREVLAGLADIDIEGNECPWCLAGWGEAHHPNCRLAALLADLGPAPLDSPAEQA